MAVKKPDQEKLVKALIWISIFVITLIGIYVLKLVAGNTINNISNAFKSVFIPFAIAFFLSFIIGPLARLLETKFHMKKTVAILLSIFLGLIFIIGLLSIVIVNLVLQMSSIFTSLVDLIDAEWMNSVIGSITSFIETYLNNTQLSDLINELTANGLSMDKIVDLFGQVFSFITNLTSSIFQAMMVLVLTPVFLFYLIKEKTYIFTGINSIFPEKIQIHLEALGTRTDNSVRNYLKGQGIMIGLIATYFAITLSILSFFVPSFGVEMALLFALVMGLFNIVPYIGAWIGLSIPFVFLFTKHLEVVQTNGSGLNIYLIAIIVVLVLQIVEQVLESSVVSPIILGNKVQIHPLLVLSSLLFFGGVFGLVGVLLAVPLAATLKSSLEYFRGLNKSKPTKISA